MSNEGRSVSGSKWRRCNGIKPCLRREAAQARSFGLRNRPWNATNLNRITGLWLGTDRRF